MAPQCIFFFIFILHSILIDPGMTPFPNVYSMIEIRCLPSSYFQEYCVGGRNEISSSEEFSLVLMQLFETQDFILCTLFILHFTSPQTTQSNFPPSQCLNYRVFAINMACLHFSWFSIPFPAILCWWFSH